VREKYYSLVEKVQLIRLFFGNRMGLEKLGLKTKPRYAEKFRMT
jgi:hypothetical protein